MNSKIKTLLAVPALSILFAGSASAMNPSSESVWKDLNKSMFTNPTLSVVVVDGVATISGDVQDAIQKHAIEQIVKKSDGVTDVLNLITSN